METATNTIFLELKDISKAFPGVQALSNVNITVAEGEVHAIVGENGAGKSTLMKILSGVYKKDTGHIIIDGSECNISSPVEAQELGITIIHQELNLINRLSVAENIYIGNMPKSGVSIRWDVLYKQAQELLDSYGIKLNARAIVGELSLAQQQMVEIAKAVSKNARIVIMDEPTSSLTDQEIEILFKIIRTLQAKNVAVLYISHKLDELYTIAEKMTILRDGQCIGTYSIDEISKEDLISKMIGRKMTKQFPPRDVQIGDVIFEAIDLSDGKKLNGISFQLHAGEVLGFSGIVGSGRTETMRLIFGADKIRSGSIVINGNKIKKMSPKESIKNGIGFVTENRKEEGLILPFSLKLNTTIVELRKLIHGGIINLKAEADVAQRYIEELRIVTPGVEQKVKLLSGGNQQKVVLAKWLYSDSDIIIMDEPTRGIDVGAKLEIYTIINDLVSHGKGVIVVSSEMEEVMGICDRIIVMREGRIAGEVKKPFSQEEIAKLAVGG